MLFNIDNVRVGIIGLGYVGLPLAVEFGKIKNTIGFDINSSRVNELIDGMDTTLECTKDEIINAEKLKFTSNIDDLKECNFYIVTVPTPIDLNKMPDLVPLIKASRAIGSIVNKGDVIVYESTVYPGATEEACIPEVEKVSGLEFNKDFFAGYSPERINPGDKEHRVTNILKVTSGSTPEVSKYVDEVYKMIISAGTHKASSIRVAEASKVIENVQRDVNIALINELHQIFKKLDICTDEVIEAASTKWNFMRLKPGLVGGHCIGVDPYYLLHKSTKSGYIPDLMRKAREINDNMASFLAGDFLVSLIKEKINPVNCRVAILGFTFKENCPDIRNTKVHDLYLSLLDLGFNVDVIDPWADKKQVQSEYCISLKDEFCVIDYDAAFLAVGHENLIELSQKYKDKVYIYDYKNLI
ncbi:nucleotide sugar dehydrogenase [Vibrio sinaloensis]|uniref:nucleotide sugar dehydrogenase n=1 Tax=Photobacterium sp. (strain ATCC 43367) TaxID=379097 RepID=UPI00057C9E72|nr:nucleotide sugar dehydrogenase [Vibrio sinaloensis]KHT52230.1 Vi polysaccharide biosynthesis protein VipA/TviB [Vibrio sinaloensis]